MTYNLQQFCCKKKVGVLSNNKFSTGQIKGDKLMGWFAQYLYETWPLIIVMPREMC